MTRSGAHSKPGDRKGVCVVPLEKGLPMKRHRGRSGGTVATWTPSRFSENSPVSKPRNRAR